jgi:carbohydrate kinase (thermoresistant glucokinase family)
MTVAIVMGVSGCGKTTVAAGIAQAMGWVLLEGDSFHPPANIAKMQAGTPLTDDDRWPWLHAIAARAASLQSQGLSCVVACSALKRAYRAALLAGQTDTALIFLRGDQALIAARLAERRNHFMPPGLLDSQFATLEPPAVDEHPIVVDIGDTPQAVVAQAIARLQEHQS